jgi:hypothetical protein
MKKGLWHYLKAAFNARPIGMFIPPNWILLAAFGLVGWFVHPALWAIGAGVELAYLYVLVTSARFRRAIDSRSLTQVQKAGQEKLAEMTQQLEEEDRERYKAVERQCQQILQQQETSDAAAELLTQGEGLGRLLWIYLRLLLTRRNINRTLKESADSEKKDEGLAPRRRPRDSDQETGLYLLQERLGRLEDRLKTESLSEELRKSLQGQIEILQQRIASRKEALEKLTFLDAELTRIQEQVKLIREQAALTADPALILQRIDQISATLGGTSQWIRDQQKIYGQVEDLLDEPPAILPKQPIKQARKEPIRKPTGDFG